MWQDLSRLGRDLSQVVIIDNSPASYVLHPENAVSIFYIFCVVVHLPFIASVIIVQYGQHPVWSDMTRRRNCTVGRILLVGFWLATLHCLKQTGPLQLM